MANLSKMQKENSKRQTVLSKLFVQCSSLVKRWVKHLHNNNPLLEIEARRRVLERYIGTKVRGIWNATYERTKMERILQSGKRGKESQGSGKDEERISQRSNTRDVERKKLALLFKSEDFKLFREWLEREESLCLSQLVSPTAKPNSDMSYQDYTWFLRGEINAYLKIRAKIERELTYLAKKEVQE
jgi:hypothetical protein